MTGRTGPFLIPALACLAAVIAARGVDAACLDEVTALAEQHRLTASPPTAGATHGGVTSGELSGSGGVVKPPPVSDRSVVAPPSASPDRMPTLPDLTPAPSEGAKDDAVRRASLQSLLIAARAQAERGEEAQCRAGLAKARELLARP